MQLKKFIPPITVVLIWTGNNIVTKLSAGAVDPGSMSFLRWLLAWIVIAPFVLPSAWRQRREIAPHLPKLAILGLLGLAMYQGLGYYAAKTMSATNIGLFISFIPLFTLGLSVVVLRARPTVTSMVGGLVSLCGVIWLLSRGDPVSLRSHGIGIGEGMMVVASLAYALYNVLLRKWPVPLTNWTSLFMQVTFAVLLLLPLKLLSQPVALTSGGLMMIAYAGIGASVIVPFMWLAGTAAIGPAGMTSFTNLVPVTTAVASVVFLGEELHGYHFVGGGLALMGVILTQLRPGRVEPQRPRRVESRAVDAARQTPTHRRGESRVPDRDASEPAEKNSNEQAEKVG